MREMIDRPHGAWSGLTAGERKVMVWICEGKCSWAVAQILERKQGTVKKHLQRVYRKLGVENRVAAVNHLRA